MQIEHALTAVGSGQTSLGIKGAICAVIPFLYFLLLVVLRPVEKFEVYLCHFETAIRGFMMCTTLGQCGVFSVRDLLCEVYDLGFAFMCFLPLLIYVV